MSKTIAMFDDVTVSLLPSGYDAYAAYADGRYENITEIRAKFPHAIILAIDVRSYYRNGDCLDVETGDATPSQAPGWFKAREHHTSTPKPILYTSASQINALVSAMSKAGIKRDRYYVWSAHYTFQPHICGPGTCGYPQADGTQWTDKAKGRSLDESLMEDYMLENVTHPKPNSRGPNLDAALARLKKAEKANAKHAAVLKHIRAAIKQIEDIKPTMHK